MQRDFLGLQKFFVQQASMPETKNVAESRMHRIWFFYFSWVFTCWRIFQVVVFNDANLSSAHCVGEGRVNVLVVYDYTVIYFREYFLENRQFKNENVCQIFKNEVQKNLSFFYEFRAFVVNISFGNFYQFDLKMCSDFWKIDNSYFLHL